MYKYLIFAALITVAFADDDAHAHVAKDYRKGDAHGHFEYGYDITNGIGADESGDEHAVHGEYHFTSKEGVPVKVSYTADEHGYHPHSDLLPTPPPTPEAILKALKYIETHPNHDDGHYNPHHDAHHDTHHDSHHNAHHDTHHDSHRNAHHDSHHNAHHDSHHNAHHDSHRNTHHDAHHNTHHDSHHNTHHDSHRNTHHGTHHNTHHDSHHDSHHSAHH